MAKKIGYFVSVLLLIVSSFAFSANSINVEAAGAYPEVLSLDNSGLPARGDNLIGGCTTSFNGSLDMSADGRYVIFCSASPDLESQRPGVTGVYLRDRQAGTTTLVSVNSSGVQENGTVGFAKISSNGTKVLFSTTATNIDARVIQQAYNTYIRDLTTGVTTLVSTDQSGTPIGDGGSISAFSADGSVVAFSTTTDTDPQSREYPIYIRNLTNNTYDTVPNKTTGILTVSADGRYVAYTDFSSGSQWLQAKVFDTMTKTSRLASASASGEEANNHSRNIGMSADGRYVLLNSNSTNLINGYIDPCSSTGAVCGSYFRKDMLTGAVEVANLTNNGQPASGSNAESANISGDGASVAFIGSGNAGYTSDQGQTDQTNAYVRDFPTESTILVSKGSVSGALATGAVSVALNYSGSEVAFFAYNLSTAIGLLDGYFVNPTVAGDNTPPVVSTIAWSVNPKPTTQSSTLKVSASDDISGIAGGEYYVGDMDPGVGAGTSMVWNGTDLTTSFGLSFQPGVYMINIRARDGAGNWSSTLVDYLVVYDPAGPTDLMGKRSIVPSLASGDTLPGLNQASQTDKMIFGFDVKYGANGGIDPTSAFSFNYDTGSKCNSQNPINCHNTNFTAESFNLLTLSGSDNSVGSFQGQGTIVVDGISSQVKFTVAAQDGDLITPAQTDTIAIKIFNLADNPATAAPLYQVTGSLSHGSGVKIQ